MEKLTLEKFLRLYSENIHQEKCVLFLGPLFGTAKVAKDGAEKEEFVHERIRTGLNEYYSEEFKKKNQEYKESEYLDCQFDNLFILKNARRDRAVEMSELRFQLKRLYQSLAPTPLYEQIARLPLNAIITCTPDLLLRKAFENIDHDFFYYSPKQQPDRPEARNNVPIIYNLFGSADDTNSFIITHETFFKFVFTMLGDNQELPVPLRNVIKKADLFIMLGFDLSKWYIPLIMRRLNEERGKEPDQRDSIFNKNKVEYTDDDEQKMSAKILVLEDAESPSEVLGCLVKEMETQGRLRAVSASPPQPKIVLPSAEARKLLKEDKLNEAIALLIKLFDEKKSDSAELYQQAGRLAYIDNQKNAGTMNSETYQEERNKIRAALLASCDEIDQKAAIETV